MRSFDNDRRLRVQYPNSLYHVTSRGVGRADIFLSDLDRRAFFGWTEQTVVRFAWRIYAIALMTNHFHLYFRTPEPNLSHGAQYLLGNYAQQFNRRHQRTGHLFEGRFRCKVIEDESYAWTVSRYVHLNPVPRLVDHPADWPWSSYPGYCSPNRRLPWVCYDEMLAAWRGETGAASEAYREYVENSLADPTPSPFDQAIDGWILGSPEFADRISQLVSPGSREPDAVKARRMPIPLPAIVAAVAAEFGVSSQQLQNRWSRHPARSIVAHLGRRYSSATLQEIADQLGLARRDCVASLARKADLATSGSSLHQQIMAIRGKAQQQKYPADYPS